METEPGTEVIAAQEAAEAAYRQHLVNHDDDATPEVLGRLKDAFRDSRYRYEMLSGKIWR